MTTDGGGENAEQQSGTIRYGNGDACKREFWTDGDEYEGESKGGRPHGKGVYRFASGIVYDGSWEDGAYVEPDVLKITFRPVSSGKQAGVKWANGDAYEGDILDGKPHGKGYFVWKNGDIYEGDFVGGKRHGKGNMNWACGGVYEGEWEGGEKHGRGAFTLITEENYEVYEGQFKNGLRHGRG